MPDEMDFAVEKQAQYEAFRLAEARQKASTRELQPTGACHWCDERVDGQRLFCDKACSEDWTKSRRGTRC